MFQHAGRGHEDLGTAGTSQGELVVLCLAYSQVGINLPDKWEEAAHDKRYAIA
jgi:hypothetical protein